MAGYEEGKAYLGALVGRYANRIAGSRFVLDGREYRLPANDGPNHLHGGSGWHRRLWSVEADPHTAELRYTSPDGEDGYPGRVEARVTYTLDDAGALTVRYGATTDRPTPINLTQHTYFNLSGGQSADILDHELVLEADRFLPVDEAMIPTGEIATVAGTVLDFRKQTPIRRGLERGASELKAPRGFDHCYVLPEREGVKPVGRIVDPLSGRMVEMSTTEPGVQLYTGNWLPRPHAAMTLESQHFPDSPNRPEFPSTILRPGELYASETIYRFGVTR